MCVCGVHFVSVFPLTQVWAHVRGVSLTHSTLKATSVHTHTHARTVSSDTTNRMSQRCVKRAFWLLVSFALLDLCFAGPRPSQRHHEPGTWVHNNPILNDQGQQRIHFPSLSDSSFQRIQIPSLSDLNTQKIEIPLLDDGQWSQVKALRLNSWIYGFRVECFLVEMFVDCS